MTCQCDWHEAFNLLNSRGYSYRRLSGILDRHKNYVRYVSMQDSPENYLTYSEGVRLIEIMQRHRLNIPQKSDPPVGQKV